MDWDAVDWTALERLRQGFLSGMAGRHDYWHAEGDLEAYDQTFGRRIAWKWDHVLADLSRLGWQPSAGEVLDWGCGSGVAGRAFLRHFGPAVASVLRLHDASRRAVRFAEKRVREEFPGLKVECVMPGGGPATGLWLISHVITELTRAEIDALVLGLAQATAVIWVEPGTFDASRALIAVRERLVSQFRVVAPCTHQAMCGMLAAGNERHWCHHFAASPPEVFMDGNWARFGRLAGIDLRSLPLSYLVLDRRGAPALPAGAVRIIGRPRVQKAWAMIFGCDAAGIRERRLMKRRLPEEFRAIKREDFDTLQAWECDGVDVVRVRPAR